MNERSEMSAHVCGDNLRGETVKTKLGAKRSFSRTATRTAGVACLLSSGFLGLATSFVSPGANASEATNVITRSWKIDGLGKRDALAELDMLIQDEALLNDGVTWSDADPASLVTPPIDEVPLKPTYVKRYDVKQAGIPTFIEGETAQFRIRVYPRFFGIDANGNGFLSNNDITVKTTTDNAATPAANCDITSPVSVESEGSLEYTCTVPNVQARALGTAEDLIHTIMVTRVATNDPTKAPLTLSESAAINVVRPCIGIKKETRPAGSNGEWLDAQTAPEALLVASGTNAEYRITVTNCGETELVNVVVNDTIAGCNRSIPGSIAVGGNVSYTTATAGSEGCNSTNVTELISSTATVTGQSLVNGRAVGNLTAADPVNVNARSTVVPTTAAPTTAAPTTAAPTTALPTTVAPTTAAPTTAAPTTAAPTTAAPTTAAPTTVEPTTIAPTTIAPTTAAPTTVEPTTIAPTTAAPTTAAPTTVATTVATTVPTVVPTVAPQGCIGIKKYVRLAGSTGPWLDAQDPATAAQIPFGADADYQIVVTNCGTALLTDVVVTDTISGCGKNIGALTVGGSFEYTTNSSGSNGCKTSPVTANLCSTATVTAQPVATGGAAIGGRLSVSDPACIATSVPATTAAPTPTTAAPTTVAAPPTTANVKVLDNVVAEVAEPGESLPVTGRNTRPLVNGAIGLFLLGLVLLQTSRRQPAARHAQVAGK
jgi:uncharacterized repeat protein (TIGR01451 family)